MTNRVHTLYFGFLILLFFGLLGCKEKTKKKEEDQATYLQQHADTFSKTLDLGGMPQVRLSDKAKRISSDWPEFLTAQSEIQKLADYSLKEIINNRNNLKDAMTGLIDSLPDRFKSTPVKSRLTVLKTKTAMLNEYAARENVDPQKIQAYSLAIYRAFANLKIQMNEIFLPDTPEFTMDQKQDSLEKVKKPKHSPKKEEQK